MTFKTRPRPRRDETRGAALRFALCFLRDTYWWRILVELNRFAEPFLALRS